VKRVSAWLHRTVFQECLGSVLGFASVKTATLSAVLLDQTEMERSREATAKRDSCCFSLDEKGLELKGHHDNA